MLASAENVESIRSRLLPAAIPISEATDLEPDWLPDIPFSDPPVAAAVLIGIIDRAEGARIVYTERSRKLRAHSGQISFPGGKLDFETEHPKDGALREAAEEIALETDRAEILGYMPPYFTGTNYLITPVVALVKQNQAFVPNPQEVDRVFEVPLGYLARRENYTRHHVEMRGRTGSTWRVEYQEDVIWGITANLTHKFYELALAE